MSRGKGQRGERQIVALLQPTVSKVYAEAGYDVAPLLSRNLMQSEHGGFDIVGLEWMALEVKYQETPQVNAWWQQTLEQCNPGQVPVLIYRKNNVAWRVVMMGYLPAGDEFIVCPCDITVDSFLKFFEQYLRVTLRGAVQ